MVDSRWHDPWKLKVYQQPAHQVVVWLNLSLRDRQDKRQLPNLVKQLTKLTKMERNRLKRRRRLLLRFCHRLDLVGHREPPLAIHSVSRDQRRESNRVLLVSQSLSQLRFLQPKTKSSKMATLPMTTPSRDQTYRSVGAFPSVESS